MKNNYLELTSNEILNKCLTLNSLIEFHRHRILNFEKLYFKSMSLESKRAIRDSLYKDYFYYYKSCNRLSSILIHHSDVDEEILGNLVDNIVNAVIIMNNFNSYYQV